MITFPIVATHRNGNTKLFYNLDDFRRFCAKEIVGEKYKEKCSYYGCPRIKYFNYRGYKYETKTIGIGTYASTWEEKYYCSDWIARDDRGKPIPKDITPLYPKAETYWSKRFKLTEKNKEHALANGGPIPWTGISCTKTRQYYRREGEGKYTTKGGKGAHLRSKIVDYD